MMGLFPKNFRVAVWYIAICGCFARCWAEGSDGLPTLELKPAYPQVKLVRPLWLGESPDGSKRIFVAGQDGQIWIMPRDRGGSETKMFMDITNRKPHEQLEEGLLGLAFHPQFKSNRKFYIFYSQQYPKRSVLSEIQASASDPDKADLSTERILMEIPKPYWNHNGGCIIFGPDGYLYVGVGDGGKGNDPHNFGQNLRFVYGKILRIDVNSPEGAVGYGIPKDNPFVENKDSEFRPETWAYGLRNPWRFSFDRQTGDLWAGDVGQDKWEEVDLIVKGGNYGWSDREAFHRFREHPEGKNWIDPIIEYGHSKALAQESKFPDHSTGLSVTGGYVYRGKKLPDLVGVYLYADYVAGTVWGLRYQNGQLGAHGVVVKGNPARPITSFGEDADGELYVMAFDAKGIYEFAERQKLAEK
ncbi:MAG TPA: PQQ-dependent sugar dehydrogenase [Verrucomicrobiae bacterium]|nr:PQQ-dependent sugar dehydrogenase [Verrucomicrobiae bacterium]